MSTDAQQRFQAAHQVYAATAGGEPATDLASVSRMAAAAIERAEEVNRQLFSEVLVRVDQDGKNADAFAALNAAVTALQASIAELRRDLADLPAAIARAIVRQEER